MYQLVEALNSEMLARLRGHMSKNKYTKKGIFKDHSGRVNIRALKKNLDLKSTEKVTVSIPD